MRPFAKLPASAQERSLFGHLRDSVSNAAGRQTASSNLEKLAAPLLISRIQMTAHLDLDRIIADLQKQRDDLNEVADTAGGGLSDILQKLRKLRERGDKLQDTKLDRRRSRRASTPPPAGRPPHR
jgi:hypothetical protein